MSNLFPLPFKRTIPINDFASSLISFITQHSSTTHPDTITADAHHLQSLRNKIYGTDGVPVLLESTINSLILYQAQLCYTLTKFPETAGPSFTYYPLFSPTTTSTSSSSLPPGSLPLPSSSSSSHNHSTTSLPYLTYELLCTLLNLSSLYVSLASHPSRSPTQDSLKNSIQYYSLALGVYERILKLLPKFSKLSARGGGQKEGDEDFERERIESLKKFVMGLSQECGWLKAVMDRLKNGTISKLALQVSEYYSESLDYASQTDNPFPEEYLGYLRLKLCHFKAVAQYRRSLDDLGSNRYGDELGRLNSCQEILKSSLASVPKQTKGSLLNELMKDSKSLLKTIEDNLLRANKDNDLIYLAHPTPPSSLPIITPFSLVSKPTTQISIQNPLKWILESQSRMVFGGMERREVGLVLEVWEDRKRSWIEEEVKGWCKVQEVQEKRLLKDLGLPESLDQLKQQQTTTTSSSTSTKVVRPNSLPQNLLDQSQEIQRLGGTSKLSSLFKDVSRLSSLNSKLLSEANEHLQSERITQEFYSSTHHSSSLWTRPSSETVSQPLLDRITHLSNLLSSAQSSDQVIRKKYSSLLKTQLELLSSPDQTELLSALPPPEAEEVQHERIEPSLEMKKLGRQLRGLLEDLKELEEARREGGRRIEMVGKQWDIRKEVGGKSDQLALRAQQGENEEGDGDGDGGELEDFEEVLREGLEGLREASGWEEERKELERRGEEILNRIRSTNSTFTSLLQQQQPTTPTSTFTSSSSSSVPSSARSDFLSSMSSAHSKFLEMLSNLEEGLKFYSDLSRLATELREGCKNFAYSRNLEAQELDKRLTTAPPTPSSTVPESHEPQPSEEEEEEDISEEDPISAAFSKPLTTTTPRRSTRRTPTNNTSTDSPLPLTSSTTTRQTRRLPTTKSSTNSGSSSSSTPLGKKQQSRNQEEEVVVREDQPTKQEQEREQGGWDPSMGIRFG